MRLLHSTEWRFQDFFDDDTPRYAILSHRWGPDEVSYQSLQFAIGEREASGELKLSGGGFRKIQKCREQAVMDQYQWVWIDTCCINKESSAELSEAINSMYRWYYTAKICYIYLSDLRDISAPQYHEVKEQDEFLMLKKSQERNLEDFKKSKWFSRGWTLQELLAPKSAVFYDSSWKLFNTRDNLAEIIYALTGIDPDLLRGKDRQVRIASTSVAKKMSWLAGRKTSRAEDMAYCMLGLFNVNMPLLYGEGSKALMRLQLEIINKSDDESIFAWGLGMDSSDDPTHESRLGMLAVNPSLFANSGRVQNYIWYERPVERLPYVMTNQGLRFDVEANNWNQFEEQELQETGRLLLGRTIGQTKTSFRLDLNCYERGGPMGGMKGRVVVYLTQWTSIRSKQWTRTQSRLADVPKFDAESSSPPITFYIRQADFYLDLPMIESSQTLFSAA